MPPPIQTNKEFVEAAGIAEYDAFLAVVVRRAVARMVGIPVQQLTAEMTFEAVTRKAWDWDTLNFALELEDLFETVLDFDEEVWVNGCEAAKAAGYPNWFYNPDNYELFSFLWKPFVSSKHEPKITFGGWVKLVVEVVLAPMRNKITFPANWPGLEASDLESDAVAESYFHPWSCLTLAIIFVTIYILWSFM